MIIGTAGHIDHGKTSLVRALTGVEGDRLKEEKARGITIDLGFAYMPDPDHETLGFVDVPGHERFVHTMLAGASGIDFALLVVAADDGVMPQTREHLAIVDLLGIRRGAVALTKADLVAPERIVEVATEIRAMLVGTKLDGADIVPVSAATGQGIDALRDRLVLEARAQPRERAAGRFRLAVDRVFTLTGIGLVVTGTVLTGSARVGDRVTVSPSGLPARVRSMHVQNEPATLGRAGDRCALNLQGEAISKDAIYRGDVVVDPAIHAPTDRIDAELKLLASEAKALRQWFPVRLHHASAEVGAHVVLLSDEAIEPGRTAQVQLVLDKPIAAAALDRFVIRDVSARRTMGGGRFLDLRPPARRRRTPERASVRAALAHVDAQQALAALLGTEPYFHDLGRFVRDRALPPSMQDTLPASVDAIVVPVQVTDIAAARSRWQAYVSALLATLDAFHAEHPDLQGIGREKLRLQLQPRLPQPVYAAALQRIVRDHAVALDGAMVRRATHTARLTAGDEEIWRDVQSLLDGDARFRPPRVRDIAASVAVPELDIRRLLKLLSRLGQVDEVTTDHFFLRSTTLEMVEIAATMASEADKGLFTAAQFRDRLDNGRKVAIQILEFFDRHGVTIKFNDQRRVNKHRLDLFGEPVHSSFEDRYDRGGESSLVGRPDFKSG